MTKLAVRKNRYGAERRATGDPAEKHAHLKLADIEFQRGAENLAWRCFGRQHDDVQIDTFGLTVPSTKKRVRSYSLHDRVSFKRAMLASQLRFDFD